VESWILLKGKRNRELLFAVGCYTAVAALIALFIVLLGGWECSWLVHDADRFHAMAEVIISGFTPYIDYVDPKPPLLFLTVFTMDVFASPGSIDAVIITGVNIGSATLVFYTGRELYDFLPGFTAGLLFLVSAIPTQGYFLFCEPFCIFLLLLSYICVGQRRFGLAGILLGLAIGYKQYAVLAVLPLIYLIWHMNRYIPRRFMGGVFAAVIIPYILILVVYGTSAMDAAIYWTFGIAPGYIAMSPFTIPTYRPGNILSFAANLLGSIVLVLPTLVFAAASVIHRGFRNAEERAIGLFVGVFLLTLLVRQYLHYWTLMMPFLALLACREFYDRKFKQKDL
jgi:hypothetical protein